MNWCGSHVQYQTSEKLDDILNLATLHQEKKLQSTKPNKTDIKHNLGDIKRCDTSLLFPLLIYHFILLLTRGIKKPRRSEGKQGRWMVVAHRFDHVRAQKMYCKEQRTLNMQKCIELCRLNSFLQGVFSSMSLQIKEPGVRVLLCFHFWHSPGSCVVS